MKKKNITRIALTCTAALAGIGIYNKLKPINFGDILIDGIPEKADDALRIMSFNLRYNDDKAGKVRDRSKIVCAILRQYAPDSFGTQEATGQWMNTLTETLGDMYDSVAVPRDTQGYKSERNAVFYLKDKYNLIDSGTIWLSETPEVPNTKIEGVGCHRIATWAVLENKATGYTYTHISTHLEHIIDEAKLIQVDVLISKIAELEKDGKVICTGDFNSEPTSEVYSKMTAILDDTRVSAVNSDGGTTFHDYGKFTENFEGAIDYIYVPEGTKVYTYKIIRNTVKNMYPSDHYPIVADIVISDQNKSFA